MARFESRITGTVSPANYGGHVLELVAGSALAQMLGTTVLSGAGGAVYFGEHRGELSLYQL